MTIIRQVWPEQDATLHCRLPTPMKAWLIMIADETPDRNMSDLVRDGVRLLMAEYGYDEAGQKTIHKPIKFAFKDDLEAEHEQSPD